MTGQALAAITTAGIGAYLGGAVGTVSGAAIASVVTTIGDAFYQRSIERTRDTIRSRIGTGRSGGPADPTARRGQPPGGEQPGQAPTAVAPTAVAPTAVAPTAVAPTAGSPTPPPDLPTTAHVRPPEPDESPTQVLPAAARAVPGDADATRVSPEAPTRFAPNEQATRRLGAEAPTAVAETPEPPETPGTTPRRASPWKRYGVLAATGLLVFLIAMVAITGVERVKGSPLSGGGPGTSVGSVLGTRTPSPTTGVAPSGAEPTSTTEAPTTTSAPESSAPTTTTTKAPARRRTTTTSDRPGDGLIPTGLLPGN